VDATTAANPTSYLMKSFTYFYSGAYGSDEIDVKPAPIASATVSAEGLSVHLKVDGRRALCDHRTHQERFAVRLPIIGRDIPQSFLAAQMGRRQMVFGRCLVLAHFPNRLRFTRFSPRRNMGAAARG
jgi:hypothetical protein